MRAVACVSGFFGLIGLFAGGVQGGLMLALIMGGVSLAFAKDWR